MNTNTDTTDIASPPASVARTRKQQAILTRPSPSKHSLQQINKALKFVGKDHPKRAKIFKFFSL